MLVLTRRVGESLLIGDHVTVTVLQLHGDQVRLGFQAPDTVRIRREEHEGHEAGQAPTATGPGEPASQ